MINPVSYQISPPEEFDFSKPTEWIKWIRRFERFRSASGLSKRDEESQKSLRTSLNPQGKTYKQSVGQNDVSNVVCIRCGKSPAHKRTQCPAKDAHCRKCKKKGHFQAVCLSGKVNTVVDDNSTCFLGALGSDEIDSLHTDPWKTSVSINGNSVEFKLDTGADLNATLRNTRRTLTGPDGSKLKVTGVISATLKANLLESKQEIFVVRNLKTALLGRPAIEALNLLKPEVIAPERLSKKDSELKQRQKENYDSRHRVHDLPPLTAGDRVYLPQLKTNTSVQREYGEGVTSCQRLMVWCGGIKDLDSLPKELVTEVPQSSPQPGMKALAVAPVPSDKENVTTRSGRVVRPPQRLVAE
ncbi:hypothetical protein P5673_019409 [Acropora cervicornis]|uniref:CCHC-type domain-containing protein n=1 Tax=Acropora cervicornis TaxID=6130 RepID=A0AAD9V230_ACRCE|nr:hypothetical protein P5673_019409 [Acropora cervicornis]